MCFIVKRWEGFRLLYIFDHTWAQLSTSVHALWQRTVVFTSHLRIFHLYGDVNTSGEELHILTHARHSWPLSSEGSFACHTYCDTVYKVCRVVFRVLCKHQSSPRTRYIHTCCRAFGSGTVTTCYGDLGPSGLGFEHPTFRMRVERSYRLDHRGVKVV